MLRDSLRDLRDRTEGAVAVSVIGLDGIAVESLPAEGVPLDLMGAEFGGFVKSIKMSNAELNTGDVLQFSVMTDKYASYLSAVTSEYFVLLVLKADGNEGRARYEIARAKQRLREDLG